MLRGPKNTFKTIFDLRTQMGLAEAQNPPGRKNRVFWVELADGGAYVCTYFLVGCVTQKGPKGSYLCGKSGPTSIRYLVLTKIDFE